MPIPARQRSRPTAQLTAVPDTVVPIRPPQVTGAELRKILAPAAAGVVVVTAGQALREPIGMTMSSFTSVSLEPALVSFCVAGSSRTGARLLLADNFAVNVLAQDQAGLAGRFASSTATRFGDHADRFGPPTDWSTGPHGLPLLAGTLARLVCEQYDLMIAGDHVIVLGLVLEAELGEADQPLLHHHGRFAAVHPDAHGAPADRAEPHSERRTEPRSAHVFRSGWRR